MSPARGKRKRRSLVDSETTESGKKRLIDCVDINSDESEDVDVITIETNGVEDSVSNEKSECNNSVKENGSNPPLENSNHSDENSKPLQSFHAKFSKSANSSQTEQCTATKHACFACKLKDGDLVKCPVASCEKFYHSKCLGKLPSSKVESNIVCPLHLCLSCYNINPRNPQLCKGLMYKCFKCPTAFHAKDECNIPGSVILTHDVMSCPDHFSPEKLREYPAVVNLLFCIQCGCNTNLTYCEYCPYSAHKDCIKDGSFVNDKYICSRCESRTIIYYNDIVWARICNFQWWPARVINPKDIPAEVQKKKHFEGEFPVKFFETNEYFWTQKGRVFPFIFKDIKVEDSDINHNFKKKMQDIVFDSAVNSARQAIKDKTLIKQLESTNNKKLPPYKHIKVNRPIGSVQIYTRAEEHDYINNVCGCKSKDPDPCGYGSLCLNRSMCTECISDVCEAGERCQNQKFQKREYASVKPFITANRGWGLKSLEDIKAGHFVIEYIGDLIDEEECERRIEEKQAIGDHNFYFCVLDSNRIIDAGPKGNFSRFLNHSCEPNCETQKWIVNGDARVGLFAKEDIPAGSELTFDYQMDFSHFEKLKCNCGSKRCSGLIGKKPQNGSLTPPALHKGKQQENGVKPNNSKPENDVSKKDKNKPLCFKCKKGGKFINCSTNSCEKAFHLRCISNSPLPKASSKGWECPLHTCKKCKSSSEYQCFTCPNAFCKKHVDNNLTGSSTFACPKHQKLL